MADRPVVDVDLHHQIADWKAVAPFVPEGLRWRVLRPAGPPMARHGYKAVGVAPPQGRAVDPVRVKEEYLEPCGIDRAILTGSIHGLGVQPNPDLSAAIARRAERVGATPSPCPSLRGRGDVGATA